jgi:hypothetical protein
VVVLLLMVCSLVSVPSSSGRASRTTHEREVVSAGATAVQWHPPP